MLRAYGRFGQLGLAMHPLHTASWAAALLCVSIPAWSAPPSFTIGIVQDGPWATGQDGLQVFQKEIEAVMKGAAEVRFPADKQIVAKWDSSSVRQSLQTLLDDPEVDLVLALGLIASHEAGQMTGLKKPIIAPLVADAAVQGVPMDPKTGSSGQHNYAFISNPSVMAKDIEVLRDLTGAHKIAFLSTSAYWSAIPPLRTNVVRIMKAQGVEMIPVNVGSSVAATLEALPEGIEAAYIGPLVHLSAEQQSELAAGLIARRVPSFAMAGRLGAERGFFAAIDVGLDLDRRARRTALNVERILIGKEDPGTLKVIIARRERLVINMATARSMSFWPNFATLTEAELINTDSAEAKDPLNIERATRMAVARNLDLQANQQEVAAGAEEIRKARANILPQVSLSASGVMIDSDRASPFANQAQRQLSASGKLTQTLYAEGAYANLSIQKHLQKSREYQRSTLVLDTVRDASLAYLDVLRAGTFERIQKDNLGLTRTNLELAEVRRSIGVAGPSEVYRWQSQLANDRASVISAIATRNATEIALNRILNLPMEGSLDLKESRLEDPLDVLGGRSLFTTLDNPWAFKIFRSFMVQEALQAAPELKAVDAALSATQRRITAAGRAWWLPTFGVQAQLDQVLAQGGAGAEVDPATAMSGIPIPNDTSWSVGVSAQIPLFAGLSRDAEQNQAERSLEQTRLQRQALAQRVEQRVRTALHQAGASFANIRLSRAAAVAAAKNLEVVQDTYARGAMTYLNLLDAQNAALVARQIAANAVYDFLVDFTQVQRAASRFDLLSSPEDRKAWQDRLQLFLQKQGYTSRGSAPAARSGAEVNQ